MYFGHALLHLLFGDSLVVNNLHVELSRYCRRKLKHSFVRASDRVSAPLEHGGLDALLQYDNVDCPY